MQTYRFDEFELDLVALQLRLRGEPVRLERRPLDLLILLVERHGQLVSRDDIIGTLWPGNVIIDFDAGLNTLIRKIRSALGDSSEEPRFIETVPGRGYRFIAPVASPISPEPGPEQPATAKSARLSRAAMVSISSVLIVGGAILATLYISMESGNEQTRIAVLPFENLTGNSELGYLAAGIAEETSMSLAQIDLPGLSIIGIVSATALANADVPLQQFGREIGADFVVLSSLRLDKSRIRVTSRLIRIADSEQIWSASFDRELTNVLGLQRELSIAIAEQVRQRLSPDVAAAIDRRQTQNPEAYELYLKGRYEWNQFQPDSNSRALQYYQQAVAADPGYALAWAGIARTLSASAVTAEASRVAIRPASWDALQRALELAPDLAETQLALGSFYLFLDRDLPRAEAAARKAVALDTNSAMSYMFLGVVLADSGKHVEARAMLRRARELDPLFPLMFANSAMAALEAGEPQEAFEFATQAIAINPEFWVGYLHLGGALLQLGDYSAAVQAYLNAEKLSGGNSARAAAGRAYALRGLGRNDEARAVLAELLLRSAERYIPAYHIALVHAALGEADAAFVWLERAMAESSLYCFDLAKDPRLDVLRGDLRFESLVKRCDFAPELDSVKHLQIAD